MNKKSYKESKESRLERLRLSKTTTTKIVPNKKKEYKRNKAIDLDNE